VRKNNFSNGAGAITDRTLEKQAFLIIPEGVAEVIFAHRLNRLQATENGLRRNDVSPEVDLRLWACLAILEAADAMKPETIGSTSARGVKASLEHRALIESLGG